jgi:hypothetical protein
VLEVQLYSCRALWSYHALGHLRSTSSSDHIPISSPRPCPSCASGRTPTSSQIESTKVPQLNTQTHRRTPMQYPHTRRERPKGYTIRYKLARASIRERVVRNDAEGRYGVGWVDAGREGRRGVRVDASVRGRGGRAGSGWV